MRRAEIAHKRIGEYRGVEQEQSLLMLRKQPEFLGVLFLRQAETSAVSITIWEDLGTVEALESSPSYGRMAREPSKRGLLMNAPRVDLLEVDSGDLRLEALATALGQTKRTGSSGSL